MKVTCLHEARHYFSRPIDCHNVQSEQGSGTFPFAIQCCNSIPPNVTWLTSANSLAAISDENGDIRLLDTSPSVETGFTTEYIRMNCHDNAIFDINWSADDMKLVPHQMRRQLMIGNCFRRSNW